MPQQDIKQVKNITLSFIFHTLIVLALFFLYQHQPKTEIQPVQNQQDRYVPAYTYQAPMVAPSKPQIAPQVKTPEKQEQPLEKTTTETEKSGDHIILKPKKSSSMLLASLSHLQEQQFQTVTAKEEEEPMYLIGDSSLPASPLITLLGRSLSAHFRYPETAARLGIRGRTVIEFHLQLDGKYSNIKMLQSSGDHDLDIAALYAINTAPTIHDVKRFLNKPKHFVIGFVFR